VARILIAEDEPRIATFVEKGLRAEGYTTVTVDDGNLVVALARDRDFDLVILDLGLPGIDGLEALRQIRARGEVIPVVILTARADATVEGFELGADDYVTKPFRLAELLARVRALLRRTHGEPVDEDEVQAQNIRVDVAAHRAFQDDRELHLTAKEFELLRVLVAAAGTVVSRETLMREVWGADPNGSTKTLDMHVSWLRRKLGDDANNPRYISTVRGMGFRFETPGG